MNQLIALDHQIKSLQILDKVIDTKKHVATSIWQSSRVQLEHVSGFYDQLKCMIAKKLNTIPKACIPLGLTSVSKTGKSVGIVFGGDDTWCGGFNYQTIAQYETQTFDKTYVFGKKIAEDIDGEYKGKLSATVTEILDFAKEIMESVARSEVSSISVLSSREQWCGWQKVLPLIPNTQYTTESDKEDNDISFAPTLILSALLYKASIATQVQENFERILATEESSKNCDQMMNELHIARNKERQKIITGEIIEIVSGYMA